MAEGANKRTMDKASLSPDASQSKKHQGGESSEKGGDSTVIIHSGEVSLSDKLSAVNKIAVDVCSNCNESCDADGVKGEALQCDLCEGWFHAACENISSKHYKSFSSLAKSIPNMVYYCKHNKCQSRIKCIVAEFTKSSVAESAQISDGFKSTIRSMDKSLSDFTVQVDKCIEDLGSRIENLLSNQTGLQMEVDSIQSRPSQPESSQSIVSTIVSTMNEEKDKERRRLNLIIHNAPESTADLAVSRKTEDIDLATNIFNVYLGAKATVTKALRLGKKKRRTLTNQG